METVRLRVSHKRKGKEVIRSLAGVRAWEGCVYGKGMKNSACSALRVGCKLIGAKWDVTNL